jgi:hypothetical protein
MNELDDLYSGVKTEKRKSSPLDELYAGGDEKKKKTKLQKKLFMIKL